MNFLWALLEADHHRLQRHQEAPSEAPRPARRGARERECKVALLARSTGLARPRARQWADHATHHDEMKYKKQRATRHALVVVCCCC
jgi:hypothetical protein